MPAQALDLAFPLARGLGGVTSFSNEPMADVVAFNDDETSSANASK